jgi:DNA-binding SARP family transcriptional activator
MNPTDADAHVDGIPFIGRSSELAALAAEGDEVPHRLILGPSGVGRTRLLAEHAARVAASGRPVVRVSAATPESDLAAAIDRGAALLAIDDLPRLPARIRRRIDSLVADPGAAVTIVAVTSTERRPDWPAGRHRVVELAPLGDADLGELLDRPPWSQLFAGIRREVALDETDHERAWELARSSGDPVRLARAVLGPELRFGYVGARAAEAGRRAEEALRGLGTTDEVLVARLLVRRALGHLGDADATVAREFAERALSAALATHDRRALGEALVTYSVADLGPDTLDERIAMAHRVLAIAAELEAVDLRDLGRFLLLGALLESGDIAAIDAELALVDRGAASPDARGSGRHVAWFRTMRALLEGRVDDAEMRATEALEIARAETDDDADSVYFGQLGIIRWLQGREHEMEPFYLGAREQQPHAPVWGGVLARLWALQGRFDLAAGVLAEHADPGGIPRDRNWLLTVCVLAETAVLLDDRAAAATLRAELLPYAARLVPIGSGIACFGSVARPLGLLARVLGRDEEAEHHLRTAIRVCSAAGARPWLAQAQLDLADHRAARGLPDDGLAAEAAATIRAADVTVLRSRTGDTSAPEQVIPEPAVDRRPVVRVLGSFEVVDADGNRATWTSRKARELLKILVTRRGSATTRETLIGMLWPDERIEEASNRLSVAISTVRRALDPRRRHPSSRFVASDGDAVRLIVAELDIDVLDFLDRSRAALVPDDAPTRRERLRDALERYSGPALSDEPDADWAVDLRLEASGAFLAVARRLGDDALSDDPLLAAETFRRILAEDPYDDGGHRGLVRAFEALGAHGRSEAARRRYYEHMAEIGLDIDRLRGHAAGRSTG